MLTGTLLWFDGVEPTRCDDSPQKGGWGMGLGDEFDDGRSDDRRGGRGFFLPYTGFF